MEEEKISENVNVPKHIWDTVCSVDAYFDYHQYLRENKYTSNHDAWEALERERESWGLPMRFTSFESFKKSRYNWVCLKIGKK